MKSFDVFLIKKMVTLTRRNNLKWKPLNGDSNDSFVSDIVQIDIHTLPISDVFRLERKQKLNPTKEHPYLYELSWERNFISSSETFNTPLYEFGQWLFADDLNWYENTQPESGEISIRQAVDSLNVQIQGLEKETEIVKNNIRGFQNHCAHKFIFISPKVRPARKNAIGKLYRCENCDEERWDFDGKEN